VNARMLVRWGTLVAGLLAGCAQTLPPTDAGLPPQPPDPPDVGLYVTLGRMHEAAHRDVPAIESYEKAVKIDPNSVRARVLLGLAYDRVGLTKLALQQHRKALELEPDAAWLYSNLGYSYMIKGQYPLAIQQFEQAIQRDPQDHRYRNNLAVAMGRAGLYQACLDEFRSTGTEAEAHYNLGCVYFYQRRWHLAAACFRKALALDPGSTEARTWLDRLTHPGPATQRAATCPGPGPCPPAPRTQGPPLPAAPSVPER